MGEFSYRPSGIQLGKMRVPLGVIGIIYEARPNVTIDCAILCLKSGNAAILRGGKEIFHTNTAFAALLTQALAETGLPADAVQLIPTTDRAALNTLLKLDAYVHCIIPRGGESLIRFVAQNSTIPVIKHYTGVCFLYADKDADPALAESILLNAKTQRPGVCNTVEQLLVHADVAPTLLPRLAAALAAKGVQLRCDETSFAILSSSDVGSPLAGAQPSGLSSQVSGLRPQVSSSSALPDLPTTPAGFDAYDVVVIANTAAGQLDLAQQTALASWVRDGGVLLFLAPDDAAMHDYVGTEIERLLPVVFSGARRHNAADAATVAFRRQIQQLGGAHGGAEAAFAHDANQRRSTVTLSAFAWEPVAGGILGADTVAAAPRFADFARVERPKPGATVLARHPSEKSSDGDGAILLALQRYGRGQSAIITSDALWRWKLNQPSTERGAELFWQNLLAWLARERPRGPAFERTPLTAETGRDLDVLVRGAGELRVTATQEGATPAALTLSGDQGRARRYRWTPPAPGMWQLTATDSEGRAARHWFVVTDPVPAGELSGLPPDETLLHELARRTGGAVLENTPPSAWLAATRDATAPLLRETRTPLWHGATLLLVLLTLYATELLLRRRWQLL